MPSVSSTRWITNITSGRLASYSSKTSAVGSVASREQASRNSVTCWPSLSHDATRHRLYAPHMRLSLATPPCHRLCHVRSCRRDVPISAPARTLLHGPDQHSNEDRRAVRPPVPRPLRPERVISSPIILPAVSQRPPTCHQPVRNCNGITQTRASSASAASPFLGNRLSWDHMTIVTGARIHRFLALWGRR